MTCEKDAFRVPERLRQHGDVVRRGRDFDGEDSAPERRAERRCHARRARRAQNLARHDTFFFIKFGSICVCDACWIERRASWRR